MLDIDTLLSAAREQTGLSDFGDPSMMDGLTRFIMSINTEANLTESGLQRVGQSTIATLVQRLQVEDYLKSNPHLLEAPIERPVFLFGLPRTGTTLAINLLTSDPASRFFMRWEAFNAVPPAAAGALRTDPRYYAEQAKLEMSLKYVPHISAMHHEDADSSTECQFGMSPSFCSQVYDSQYHMPSYSEWFLHADYRPAFRYHKRLMQVLQQNNGGRWTFKNPWHPLYLDALTDVYPDARLIMTHRNLTDTVASACSLVHAVRKLYSDVVDPHAIADTLCRTFDLMISRMESYEAKHGAGSIHHIRYPDMMADPIGEIRKAYTHFNMDFTPQAEAAMQAMLDANPKGKHGKHSYALEDYGLSREIIAERYSAYIDRFGLDTA